MRVVHDSAKCGDPAYSASELGLLTEALRVLESLNNPQLSTEQLADTGARMPQLCARVSHEFHRTFVDRTLPSVATQLEALGPKRFELLVYNYLEAVASGNDL